MNPEELKYLRALQPEIVKAMGPILANGDRYACECGFEGICGISVHTDCEKWDTRLLRIPLAIDPENPERGLLGMLLGQGLHDYKMYPGETSTFFDTYNEQNELVRSFHGNTPYLALLKALAYQRGVEVS